MLERKSCGAMRNWESLSSEESVQTGDIGYTCSETWVTVRLRHEATIREGAHALESCYHNVIT
jgi:hypothetical protein